MGFLKKKPKETEEEVLEYFYGKEYVEEKKRQETKGLKRLFMKKAEKDPPPDSFEMKRRKARFWTWLLWGSAILIVGIFSVFTFYPKAYTYIGIVKPPEAIPVYNSINQSAVTLEMSDESEVFWQDDDYYQRVHYTITNNSNQFAYPDINLKLFNDKNEQTETQGFGAAKEVLAPGEALEGYLIWARELSAGATKAYFVWKITLRQENILENPEEAPTEESVPNPDENLPGMPANP